ncbi:MAG: efflux RND transporter permease subunit [Sulfuricaulis sp.]|nr:efflux RND transporter permease subunit [Sulfuricaulis sp.]
MPPAAARPSSRHRFLIGVATLAILLLGFFALGRLPLDLLPVRDAPTVRVQVSVPGVTASVIEEMITRRLEHALTGVTGVAAVASVTSPGNAVLDLHLTHRRKTDAAQQDVAARLEKENSSWPASVDPPMVSIIDASSIVAEFTISSRHHDMLALRDWAEDEFANKLQELSGVATVDIEGGAVREVLVMPDQRRLAGFGLAFSDVLQALRKNPDADAGTRAPAAMGRRAAMLSGNVAAVAALPVILPGGESIALSEAAKVVLSRQARSDQGAAAIRMTVHKLLPAATSEVAERIQSYIEWMRANRLIPENIELHPVSNRLAEARQSLRHVAVALVAGLALVLLAARLLLGSGRRTLILGVVIGSALQATFIVMALSHLTLDVMTLGALALGVGLFGGCAVLTFENRAPPAPGQVTAVNPAIAAAVAMPAALMPVFLAGGEIEALFRDFVLVFCGAWLVAAVLALILVPAFDARQRRRGINRRNAACAHWVVRARRSYRGLLRRLLRHPCVSLVGVLVLAGTMTAVIFVAPQEFPSLDDARNEKIVLRIQGSDASRLAGLGDDIARRLRAVPGLRDVKHSAELSREEPTLRMDEVRARELGIDIIAAGKALAIALNGIPAGSFRDAEHRYDIRLRLPPEESADATALRRILLLGELDDRPAVYLGDVATVEQTAAPAQIRRHNGVPIIEVTASFAAGSPPGQALIRAQDSLRQLKLPTGYRLSYGPSGKVLEKGHRPDLQALGLALLWVFAVQVLLHRSIRMALLVALTTVSSLAGAGAALLIFGLPLSAPVWLGILISIGVTAGYATWTVMYIVARREPGKSLHKNILWATKLYLRPLLVATLLAQFGMLSLMLVKGAAMVLHPLIITVVMGLFFSLLVNLLIVPVLYLFMERRL